MTTNVDLAGNTLHVEQIVTGVTKQGQPGSPVMTAGTAQTVTAKKNFSAGINTRQVMANVDDTTPTEASLTSAFGTPASLGRGFIGTIDDNDGDTNGFLVWTSDASWYFLKGTKAS